MLICAFFSMRDQDSNNNDVLALTFWSNNEVNWSTKGANENEMSGGLLIMWKEGSISPYFSFLEKGFIVI